MSTDTAPVLAQDRNVTAMSHFVCCDFEAPEGTVCRSLCGQPDLFEESDVDTVDCVVCTELDRVDYCPEMPDHRCKRGKG